MKKIIVLTLVFVLAIGGFINKKANAITEEEIVTTLHITEPGSESFKTVWKPMLSDYLQGNYLGALTMCQSYLKNHERHTEAKYFLALCYHNLGYYAIAKAKYQEIVDAGKNSQITSLAEKGIACIDSPKSEACTGKKAVPELTEMEKAQKARITQLEKQLKEMEEQNTPKPTPDDDITTFIKSKQQIHPAAMDRITIERMERKLQEAEWEKKNAQQQ